MCLARSETEKINLGEKVELYSKVLKENRYLYISYPSSFDNNKKKYPVLYLLDGDYYLKSTAGIIDYLSYVYELMPELIVVGVGNLDRIRDMTPSRENHSPTSGGADKFYRFFTSELIPFIEKNYRVTSYKIILGHSLGGLFTLYSFLKGPFLFNAYIAISPSINWNNFEPVSEMKKFFSNNPKVKGFLFMSMSNEGGGDGFFRLNELYENIKPNIPKEFILECRHYPEKNHLTTYIPAVMEAFLKLFNDWKRDRK